MPTLEEIADHIKKNGGLIDFTAEVLGRYLPHALYARASLKVADGVDPASIEVDPPDPEAIKKEMLAYLDFAWGKCADHRGLSASRSISKLRAWVWLLGDTESIEFLDIDSNYKPYGAPMLAFLAKKYGTPLPTGEYIEMMIAGNNCPDCS